MSPEQTLFDFSPASRRVLVDAARRSEERGDIVRPADVLHSLWADDSRAAEMLRTAGYSDETLTADFPPGTQTEDDARAECLPLLINEARRLARRQGRGVEVATEHLLAAVMTVQPDIATVLAARGLVEDTIAEGLPEEDSARAPLHVEAEAHLRIVPPAESFAAARILDAAANRCREGLRVVEDYVRFSLDDAVLSEQLKSLRHHLAAVLIEMGCNSWLPSRDTPGDVGTRISTSAERSRRSIESVVAANCKRVQESLRTLEEYGKLLRSTGSQRLEALRYHFYSIEQALAVRHRQHARLATARLYLLVTDRLCPRGFGPVVRAAIAGGVDVVQLREKDISDRRLLDLARYTREWTREAGVLFVINDRPDIASIVDADGVHLGQDDMPVAAARRILGPDKLVGVSTHTIEQAREAVLAGADYLGVGPVFASNTKSFDQFAGLEFVRAAAAEVRLPWFAIGGISETNLDEVAAAGATRIAVSSAICAATDPQQATADLSHRLNRE